MNIFASQPYYQRFAAQLLATTSGAKLGNATVHHYPNGELYTTLETPVTDEACLLIGSAAPPATQLLSLLALIDTLKRHGAASIHVLLPYLGYARQDKPEASAGGGIAFVGALLKSAGANRLTCVDVHSPRDKELVGLPLRSLSSSALFVDALGRLPWKSAAVIAPDEGARGRVQALARKLPFPVTTAYFVKRHVNGIIHTEIHGDIDSRVILYDDILDTGRTLISAIRKLKDRDVTDIVVAVTHGVLTGDTWKQLFRLGVRTLYLTDSCPRATATIHPRIRHLSLAPFVAQIFTPRKVSGRNAISA